MGWIGRLIGKKQENILPVINMIKNIKKQETLYFCITIFFTAGGLENKNTSNIFV